MMVGEECWTVMGTHSREQVTLAGLGFGRAVVARVQARVFLAPEQDLVPNSFIRLDLLPNLHHHHHLQTRRMMGKKVTSIRWKNLFHSCPWPCSP